MKSTPRRKPLIPSSSENCSNTSPKTRTNNFAPLIRTCYVRQSRSSLAAPTTRRDTVEWELKDKQDRGDHLEMTGTLTNKTYNEELNVAWLYPKQWNGRAVIWLDDSGKSALQNEEVKKLVAGGAAVLGVDLLLQGGEPVKQTAVVKNPREFAGYTHGYNHALFAQRTHDVLSS
jgi:hypothetical protein